MLHVERVAAHPCREAGRCQQVVERQRQLEAIRRREEGVEIERADAANRWRLHESDQARQVEVLPRLPGGLDQLRDEDVLARANGIRIDPDEPQKARCGNPDLLPEQVAALHDRGPGGAEGGQYREPASRVAARREDAKVRAVAESGDPLAGLAPFGEAVLPEPCLSCRELGLRLARSLRLGRVDPGLEVCGPQFGERQQEVRQIALGVDDQGRYSVESRFFQKRNAKPRLAAARHADANGVCRQVLRVVDEGFVTERRRFEIVPFPEVEAAESLVAFG